MLFLLSTAIYTHIHIHIYISEEIKYLYNYYLICGREITALRYENKTVRRGLTGCCSLILVVGDFGGKNNKVN